MKTFYTVLYAINPKTSNLDKWAGPHIQANSYIEAVEYKNNNGMGYLHVLGTLEESIDFNLATADANDYTEEI